MATKIKDAATAERAAMKLQQGIEAVVSGEPNAPREKTTSERLFPEFTTDDGGIVNRPVRENQIESTPIVPAPATPQTPTPQGQTPATQPPTTPTYIKPEDLIGKMARLKVDGVEQDVPAESLFKTNQLERHLNARLMEVAQEAKRLEDERRRLAAQPPAPAPDPNKKPPEPSKKSAEIEALEARLAQMEAERQQEKTLLLPQIQEAGIKRVEQMAKDRLGTDDYRTYHEKIRDAAFAEMAKPENATNPQARAYFDSDAFYFQKYQEMKLRDLMAKPATPAPSNPNAPVLVTPQGAPVVVNNSGQPVNVPTFEPSGGVPSRMSPDTNWQGTYNTLLKRAQENNTDADWLAVMRHKFNRDNS